MSEFDSVPFRFLACGSCKAPFPVVNVIAEPPKVQPQLLALSLRGASDLRAENDQVLSSELAAVASLASRINRR